MMCPMCSGAGGFQNLKGYDPHGSLIVHAEACGFCYGTGKTNGLEMAKERLRGRKKNETDETAI